jgi:hypothetical protein
VKKSAEFCRQTLGEPAGSKGQVGYPDSLALCVIDSIWSLAANYDSPEFGRPTKECCEKRAHLLGSGIRHEIFGFAPR